MVNMNGRNRSVVSTANFSPTIWDIGSPVAYRSKKYYGGWSSWPDITVQFRMRRRSFVDQKIAVLPIIRKRQRLFKVSCQSNIPNFQLIPN